MLALRYNPNIQNAEINRVAERFGLSVARNEFELQYALTGNINHQRNSIDGVSETSQQAQVTPAVSLKLPIGTQLSWQLNSTYSDSQHGASLGMDLKQPLLQGAGRSVTLVPLKNAIDQEQYNKLALRQTITDEINRVIISYRQLILDQNELKTLKNQVNDAERTSKITRARIKVGKLPRTSILQADAQLAQLRFQLKQAENKTIQDKQSLLEDVGLNPEKSISVPVDVQLKLKTLPAKEMVIQQALAQNIGFQQFLLQARQDQRNLLLAKDSQKPQLDLTAGVNLGEPNTTDFNEKKFIDRRIHEEHIGLSLSVPIHDMTRKQQLVNAKTKTKQNDVQLVAKKRTLITAVKNQLTDIGSQYQAYKIAKHNVTLAQQSYTVEKKKQQYGKASSLDVTNSQDKLIDAKNNLIISKLNYLNAWSQLQSTLDTTLDEWGVKVRY